MVVVDVLEELKPHVGQELGVSEWVALPQPMLDQFGALTGDKHWIHTDPERARREGPYGGTIAHGFLTLSLLTGLLSHCFQVRSAKRWVNYGLDKVRFTAPVPAGSRLRLRLSLATLEPQPDGAMRLRCACSVEIDGGTRPAMAADFLMLAYE